MSNASVSTDFGDVKPFVSVDAQIVQAALKTARAPVLRWVLWIALRSYEERRRSVLASPAVVARSFAGSVVEDKRAEGYAGTSAVTFQRHRDRLLGLGVTVDERGRYRLPMGPRWHRVDLAALRWLVFEATGPALRAAVAMWVPLSMASARGQSVAVVTSERLARTARMGASRSCRAVRECRIAGVLGDNRPGRRWTGATRRPPRAVAVSSILAPVPGRRFAPRDQIGHINPDMEPEAITPKGETLSSRTRHDAFEAPGFADVAPASAPSGAGSVGVDRTIAAAPPCDIAPATSGEAPCGAEVPSRSGGDMAPMAPGRGRASSSGRRITRAGIRAAIGRSFPGVTTGERSIGRLARSLPDLADLEWFLGRVRDSKALAGIEHAGAWLASVAEAEAASIRARKWKPKGEPSGALPGGARGLPAAEVSPAVVAFAERAVDAARAARRQDRPMLAERARVAAERARRPDLARIAVELAEVDRGQGHRGRVADVFEAAGLGRAARIGAFVAPAGRELRPGHLVVEVGDDAELSIVADQAARLWAAWSGMGGVTLGAVAPSGRRVRLTGGSL